MKKRLSLAQIKANSKVVLNDANKSMVRGGMKRFEELRDGGSANLYDADSETFDR